MNKEEQARNMSAIQQKTEAQITKSGVVGSLWGGFF